MEFHRFADALIIYLEPYLPGFLDGTDSKFNYVDLRILRGAYGTTNSQRCPVAKPCDIRMQLILHIRVNWKTGTKEVRIINYICDVY